MLQKNICYIFFTNLDASRLLEILLVRRRLIMAAVLKVILRYSGKVLSKYGYKALMALTRYVRTHWRYVARMLRDVAVWEVIQRILHSLGF